MAIYKVTTNVRDSTGEGVTAVKLVEAPTAAQAIKHAVSSYITCEVCSVPDALALGAGGTKIEKAGGE